MSRKVLVPEATRPLFDELEPGRFAPAYYTYRRRSRSDRWLHRLGWPEPRRLRLPDGVDLESVDALWLSGDVELSPVATDHLLAQLPRLAWVYSERTGTEYLAEACYRRRGIAVSNTGVLVSQWVAEMQVACLVSQAKQLPGHRRLQDRHRFATLRPRELSGLHVLVVGTGAIGGATARLCRGLGMRVTGASRSPARLAGAPHDYDAVVALSDALLTTVRDADAVVLCLPQTAETVGLVGREVLGRMQPTATLINLARPLLVDEHALVRCLRDRGIAAAWVSRTETLSLRERLAADRLPNFFLTHYMEARVASRRRRSFEQFVDLADRQRAGEVGNRVI